MSLAETLSGLGIVALGGFILLETLRKLPYAVDAVPGPGFLPLWLSLGIIALGLVLTVQGLRTAAAAREVVEWPERDGWRRIAIVVVALAAGLWLLEPLGFLLVMVLYVAVVGFGLGMRSWRVLVPVSLLVAVALYGIFGLWLRVPLPKGILAF